MDPPEPTYVEFPPTRDARLPRFILYPGTHPLWTWGNAFVYEWDTDPERQGAFFDYADTRTVTGRFEDELIAGGELELKPYEAIFVRQIGATDPLDDNLQAMVTDEKHLSTVSPTFYEEILRLRDEMLGPEYLRTPDAPSKGVDGQFRGGVLFERNRDRASPVIPGKRCYQYQGLSTEIPRNVSSANANSKTPSDSDRELKTHMLKNFITAAIATIKLAPPSFHRAAITRAELVNSPHIGNDDNVYFDQVQLNVSKCYGYHEKAALDQLGFFGSKHFDRHDHEGKLTVAGAFSHMPTDYHPGLFFLYELGVFVRLNTGHHVCFSGLRLHGGTPPIAPEGQEPVDWACRCLHISYPSSIISNMTGRQALGPIPGDETLYIPPEMMDHCVPDIAKFPLHTKHTNYIQDGVGMMSPKAHVSFVSRLLLRLCQHQTAGMPYKVHIDTDKFLSSFNYEDVNGEKHTVPSWQFAERFAYLSDEQESEYEAAWNLVDQHTHTTKLFIPHIGRHAKSHTPISTFEKLKAAHGEAFMSNFQRHTLSENSQTNVEETVEETAKEKSANKKGKEKEMAPQEDIDAEVVIAVSDEEDHTTPELPDSQNTYTEQDRTDLSSTHTFGLFMDLTLPSLEQTEEELIRDSVRTHGHNASSQIQQSTETSQLASFLSDALHYPLEDQTIKNVRETRNTIASIKGRDAKATFHNRVMHQHVMLANGKTWNWLNQTCEQEVLAVIQRGENGHKVWSKKLVQTIHTFLETRTSREIVLQRTDYAPFASMKSKKTLVKRDDGVGKHVRLATPEDIIHQTIHHMTITLADWLDFDTNSLINFQASFVNMLIGITGSADILLLDATWKAYCHPKSRLFGNHKMKKFTGKHLAWLEENLKAQPWAAQDSLEYAIIRRLASLHTPFSAWTPESEINKLISGVECFVNFLRLLDPILHDMEELPTDSELFQKIKQNLDYYLPFRENAPSRIREMAPNGIYHGDFIRTRGGIFSALIYRAVTYGAPAEKDAHGNKFQDMDAWTNYFNNMTSHSLHAQREPLHYFCKINAYGTPNPKRHPKHIQKYWAGSATWEEFITASKPTLLEMQTYLQQEDAQGSKIFPNVGSLTAYLLTVDLFYAGIVQECNAEEMGQMIYKLGRGSYRQLVELNALKNTSGKEESGVAFERFYDAVYTKLTVEERERWKFSPFIVEHSLCKQRRLRAYM